MVVGNTQPSDGIDQKLYGEYYQFITTSYDLGDVEILKVEMNGKADGEMSRRYTYASHAKRGWFDYLTFQDAEDTVTGT